MRVVVEDTESAEKIAAHVELCIHVRHGLQLQSLWIIPTAAAG